MTILRKILVLVALLTIVGGAAAMWSYTRPSSGLSNPASVYCENQGGTLEIRNEASGQIGYCHVSDGSVCEEWAYFRDGVCTPPPADGVLPYNSGIHGTVMLGPTCPVMRNPPDPQCADKPYATTVTIFHASDTARVVATARSSAQGVFAVSLPPGQYIIEAGDGSMLPRCAQTPATVGPNAYTDITVSCDSGIR